MTYVKLNGLISEILARYPPIDIAEFLQDNLSLPPFKAEELAARIQRQYLATNTSVSQSPVRTFLERQANADGTPQSAIYSVESLSKTEFERFVKWLLEELGYHTESEVYPAALGLDFVASKDGVRMAVMARKCPSNLKVSDAIVWSAQDAKRIYQCRKALVVATASFTQQAIQDAKEKDIDLWDLIVLNERITQVAKKADANQQFHFPAFHSSLLHSISALGKTKAFLIEPRAAEKYDLFLPGVRYPLLTFQVAGGEVVSCVFRIRYNEPVVESAGEVLISCSGAGRVGPDDAEAYGLVVEYLEQFIE